MDAVGCRSFACDAIYLTKFQAMWNRNPTEWNLDSPKPTFDLGGIKVWFLCVDNPPS
jgi:hypothetical protein